MLIADAAEDDAEADAIMMIISIKTLQLKKRTEGKPTALVQFMVLGLPGLPGLPRLPRPLY